TPIGGTKIATLFDALPATTTGVKQVSDLAVDFAPGLYWIAYMCVGGGLVLPTSNDPLTGMVMPHREGSLTRTGGLASGVTTLTALPETPILKDTWDTSGAFWYAMQTQLIP